MTDPREVAHVLDICNVRLGFGLHSSAWDRLARAIAARDAEVGEDERARVAKYLDQIRLGGAADSVRSLTSGTPR